MSTAHQDKPTFKAPDQKPFKAAEDPSMEMKSRGLGITTVAANGGWAPLDTAPQNADAVFLVRAVANGKGIPSTETQVRYRASRKMVGGKWKPAFTIIDDKLGTKLGFRPNEWRALDTDV